ncbi:MAG: hypothetical protein ACKOBV_06155 [Candidatus Kapaibacterium sp.]
MKKTLRRFLPIMITSVLAVIATAGSTLCAQTSRFGRTYLGEDGYIEYQPGTMPLVISVPHGGSLAPASFPDRDCEGCSYVQDAYTQELARSIREEFHVRTGCYPHVIYNLLHRKKLDMNRDSVTATDSNAALTTYWKEYHAFIDSAKSSVAREFGKGLFIDLHGHGHAKARIEFGYLLDDSRLRENDSILDMEKSFGISSIRSLVGANLTGDTHAELIRGDDALGTMFGNEGYPGVPSKQDPYPLIDDPYFNGGFNTLVHGSRNGGVIDAIQMELNSALRFTPAGRSSFSSAFVRVLRSFLGTQYLAGYASATCTTSSTADSIHDCEIASGKVGPTASPNPVEDRLTLGHVPEGTTYAIFSGIGVKVREGTVTGATIPLHDLPSGTYGLILYHGATVYHLSVVKL